ncbi:N-acetyltransferase family protein [Streptomyces althioticus]|uniref:GNAT family N-acetyltransferase n=2 Tax=Streptomyces TaxID=1883 RepID=UPI0038738311|nr:GNAT family N-acetyltransferase [Streptomyces althioticus]
MPEPLVRPARPDDEGVLARLDRESWSPLFEVRPAPPAPDDPFFRPACGPDAHLVAEDDGRVVGYVRLLPASPLETNAHVLQICGLVVAEEARGKGAGRALVRAAVEEARRRGARRITLRVLGPNTVARTLYTSEGFAVEGVLPGEFHVGGRYVDDVLMGRSLLRAAAPATT